MKFANLSILMLTVVSSASLARDTNTNQESATPESLSQWCTSNDGNVSACFALDKTTYDRTEVVTLRCALRNNADKPIIILRPFGDSFYTHAYGLTILGPNGPIPYRGAFKEYMLGMSAFIELNSHMVVEGTMELLPDVFPGLGDEGLYVISYEFMSDGYPIQPPPENYWKGKIKTGSVTMLIKGKDSQQSVPGYPPQSVGSPEP